MTDPKATVTAFLAALERLDFIGHPPPQDALYINI
jgi:hypothetical protein